MHYKGWLLVKFQCGGGTSRACFLAIFAQQELCSKKCEGAIVNFPAMGQSVWEPLFYPVASLGVKLGVVRGAFAGLHVYPMYNKPSKWRKLRSTPQ